MNTVQGTNWSASEVEACVDAYFGHLKLELTGHTFNKAQLYRQLSEQSGRSTKSIEYKFQNISAVLHALGREWMTGLAPMANYQELLAEKVADHIADLDAIPLTQTAKVETHQFEEAAAFYLEAPPELTQSNQNLPEYIAKLVRRFDPVERDARNRALGEAGERFVLNHETRFLESIERPDLAKQIRWISKEEGDGAGYDILSFTPRGDKKLIEVKTTLGGNRTPFFLSRNEHDFCKAHFDQFNLVRLYDFRKSVRGFELPGDISKHVRLSTENYRAEFE
jgi:hypothetical protein